MNLSGHQSAKMGTDTWLTPPSIIGALGRFDLDPCCPPSMPWKTADRMISLPQDGLAEPWAGRVWLNPPFGQAESEPWLAFMKGHKFGTLLYPARTETQHWFNYIWPVATAILFLEGRPHFHYADGSRAKANSGAPIALVAYGHADAVILRCSLLRGAYIPLSPMRIKKATDDFGELCERTHYQMRDIGTHFIRTRDD